MSSKSTKSFSTLTEVVSSAMSKSKCSKASINSVIAELTSRQSELVGASGSSSRKKKDPNAPKKPRTGYIIFCSEQRETMKAQNPDMNTKELTSALANRWQALSDAEKKKYTVKAEKDKERYASEMETYTPPEGLEQPVSKAEKKAKKNGGVKNALTAYMWFCKAQREAVKRDHPEMGNKEIVGELARRWNETSDAEKAPYNKQHEQDCDRRDRELVAAGLPVPERKSRAKASATPAKSSVTPAKESKTAAKPTPAKTASKTPAKTESKSRGKPTTQNPGFARFVTEERDRVKKANPRWNEKKVNDELVAQWEKLPEDERQEYEEDAQEEEELAEDDE